jgi:hypothetical protein
VDCSTSIAPFGRYHRHLAGADFTLEANTAAANTPGLFYVFVGGKVLLESDDFGQAESCYKDLCRQYWDEHLASPDRAVGLASAWGLLGLNLNHAAAGALVQELGTAADRKRLEQLRGRARAMKRGGWKKRGNR